MNSNSILFLMLVSFAVPIGAMENSFDAPQPNPRRPWESVFVDGSTMCPSFIQQGPHSIYEMHRDYHLFLLHIGNRVMDIEKELIAQNESTESGWRSWVVTVCAVVKSYARSIELMVKDPESEKMAQNLQDQIAIAKSLQKTGQGPGVHPDMQNQMLVERVQAKIQALIEMYKNNEASVITIQVGYLREYGQRIEAVEKALQKSFNGRWGQFNMHSMQ